MLATPENGNAFSASQGASFLVAGLTEVAAEIERHRMQSRPQEIRALEDECFDDSPDGAIVGCAFALGAFLPLVSHATSLGFGAATKLLLISASLAPALY